MATYTLKWQNDTTDEEREIGQYDTLSDAVKDFEYHWRSVTNDPNYISGDYQNSYLYLDHVSGKALYYMQCKRHQWKACMVRIGFVEYEPLHPLLEVLEARLGEGDIPELNCWDTNNPAVLYALAKRYKQQCNIFYIYPDGTEYLIRVDSDGDLIDEIPDQWGDKSLFD